VCIAFAGIGNPEPFYLEIRKMGLLPMRSYRFGDHHRYRPSQLRRMARRWQRLANQNALQDSPLLITTEKDAMRLLTQPWFVDQYRDYPFYYLEIALEVIRGKDSFEAAIQAFATRHRP
jgi:tetraacyldisaccharide 4'-kinase